MISLTGGSMRDDVLHCSEDNASQRLKATGAGHPTKQFLHSPTKNEKIPRTIKTRALVVKVEEEMCERE